MTDIAADKQDVNAIYDSGNYTAVFEQDLIEAEKEIVISSPRLTQEKVGRFIYLMKSRQESGIKITVITVDPENASYGSAAFFHLLIDQMKEAGIQIKIAEDEA